MQTKREIKKIQPSDISRLLLDRAPNLMSGLYEMQSSFLSGIYKRHKNIETANIILCLTKIIHLEIIRQREKNIYHDVSLENFWNNYNNINKPTQKIISIVNITGIPKETARRKIKNLVNQNFVKVNISNREYHLNILPKYQDNYSKIINYEIEILAKFISICAHNLRLNIDKDTILNELKSHFSFYWYHFINCQLKWLRMWKDKIKDVDLILITLQAIIPTLQYADKNQNIKDAGLENLYMIMDKTGDQYKFSNTSISATSVSEITGIPRATCIRKLEMLMKLGVLMQEAKTKRYYVNQLTSKKTNKILTKDNTLFTIENFSECSAIILNAITATKR